MAKYLTIQDLQNTIRVDYNINNYNGIVNNGINSKCDLSKYYDNPMDIINYDPVCAFNSIPNFSTNINNINYKTSLDILNNVSKKFSKKRMEEIYGPSIDYSNHNNFIYYDETNKPSIR